MTGKRTSAYCPGMVIRRITSQFIVSVLAATAVIAALLTALTSAQPAQAATPAQTVVEAMQPGWNLGNSFDAIGADETAWGNPVVTKALLDNIKAQGFKSVRIRSPGASTRGLRPRTPLMPRTWPGSSRWSTGRWPTTCTCC